VLQKTHGLRGAAALFLTATVVTGLLAGCVTTTPQSPSPQRAALAPQSGKPAGAGPSKGWLLPPAPSAKKSAKHRATPEGDAPQTETQEASLTPGALPPAGGDELVMMSFTGRASWYGKRFHGRRTASGERYDMAAFTAAHPTLPFGSRVRVTNLDNGRSVVVTINDRGPYVKTRLIDVSRAAATELGMIEDGVAEVRVDVLEAEEG